MTTKEKRKQKHLRREPLPTFECGLSPVEGIGPIHRSSHITWLIQKKFWAADEESADSQRMCLLLEALLAVAPLVAECAVLRSPARSLASHLIAQATPSTPKVRPLAVIEDLPFLCLAMKAMQTPYTLLLCTACLYRIQAAESWLISKLGLICACICVC